MLTLGDKIKQIRKKMGLNKAEFANKIGLESAVAVSNYENNKRSPDKNKLIIISKLGNISLDELITGDKKDYPDTQTKGAAPNVSEGLPDYGKSVTDALFSSDQKINIEEAMGKTYKVLSAGTALSVALYMNIQQFAAALDTGQALQLCQDQMKGMQEQIDILTRKVDALTAPSSAGRPGDGSEKEAM